MCRLSGYFIGILCRKAGLTAEKVANFFLRNVVAVFGLPHEIMSDCDHLINSKFFNTLCALSGVTQHTSIIYRPRGNGRAETAVRLVVDMLRRSLAYDHVPWIQVLPWALWQLNDLPGVNGVHSPHKIVFGRDPIGLGDAPQLRLSRPAANAEKFTEDIQALRRQVRDRLVRLHEENSARFNRHHVSPEYPVGDRVWVRNHHGSTKLDPLWTGPCEILARVGATGRYKVALPHGPEDVHLERLKLYLPMIDGKKLTLHYFRPHRELPEDDFHIVEKIVSHRRRNGILQWRVRWKGYDSSFDTWEPAASFVGPVQMDWVRYNTDNHIEVKVADMDN